MIIVGKHVLVPHATNKIEYIRNAKLYYAFWVQKNICRLESVIGKIIKMDISLSIKCDLEDDLSTAFPKSFWTLETTAEKISQNDLGCSCNKVLMLKLSVILSKLQLLLQ